MTNIYVTAHRPWGTYTILDESDIYKVKRIVVKLGKRFSFQKHHHRSQYCIVVSGTAVESTYIPMGKDHHLEDIGKIDLVMIEAQVGEYVGDNDIVRIENYFARN